MFSSTVGKGTYLFVARVHAVTKSTLSSTLSMTWFQIQKVKNCFRSVMELLDRIAEELIKWDVVFQFIPITSNLFVPVPISLVNGDAGFERKRLVYQPPEEESSSSFDNG